jgi:hypothetical protein
MPVGEEMGKENKIRIVMEELQLGKYF